MEVATVAGCVRRSRAAAPVPVHAVAFTEERVTRRRRMVDELIRNDGAIR
jgi:hypothetical protein